MSADQNVRTSDTLMGVRNEQLAELVERNHESVLWSWVRAMKDERIYRLADKSDEVLREQFEPTVCCMIHLLRTGDISAASQYMRDLIARRMNQGCLLVEIERSIYTLQEVVMCLIERSVPDPEQRVQAIHAISELHDITSLRVAEVYREIEEEDEQRFLQAYELGTDLSKSLDLDTVLDLSLRRLGEYMGATSTALVLTGRGEHGGPSVSQSQPDPELAGALPGICRTLGCGPEYVEVLEARAAACIVPDISRSEALSAWSGMLSARGFGSLACVPLITAERVLGTAVILMAGRRDFKKAEVDFILALVGHIAAAIQNALLFEEAKGKRELDLLLSAGKLFASSLELQEVLNQAARISAESLNAEYSFVLLEDEAGKRLHVSAYAAAPGTSPDSVRSIMARVEPAGLEVGIGASGKALATGKPLLINNYADYPGRLPMLADVTGSIMIVPMRVRNRTVGGLALVSFHPNAFSEHDLALAGGVADQAAIAIDNARLYESAERSAAEAQTLYRIAVLASSTLELDRVLDILVQEIADIAKVGRTGLYLFDPDSERIRLSAQVGFDMDECRSIERELVGLEVFTSAGKSALYAGAPIFIPDPKYHTERLGELLRKYGVVCGLTLPFVTRGKLVGAALVDDRDRCHDFTPSVIRLLSSVASTAAISIQNARLMQHERNIAETLQESFLPRDLPTVPGYGLAAEYRAALAEAQVGGDFYDAFDLGNGCTALLIADVSGKGIAAATYTAAGKYMLRAYAMEDPEPGRVLRRLNSALSKYMPIGMFITMFLGVLDTSSHVLTYANAGHDEPLFFHHGGKRLKRLDVTGTGLGAMPTSEYGTSRITFDPGDSLMLYTDGATDVRRDGEFLGTAGLERVFLAVADQPAERIREHVFGQVEQFGRGKLGDDVALLVLRRDR